MVRLIQRRHTDPWLIKFIWSTIAQLKSKGSNASLERIVSLISNCLPNEEPDKLSEQIQFARLDKFVSIKGHGSDSVFRICEPEINTDNDSYCFECHLGGEVVTCDSCKRVYHSNCLADNDWIESRELICQACETQQSQRKSKTVSFKILNSNEDERTALNYIISLIVSRLKAKASDLAKMKPSDKYEEKLLPHLVFFHIDLNTILKKCEKHLFQSVEELKVDLLTLAHSFAVFHGKESAIYNKTQSMIDMAKEEIRDAVLCPQCYRVKYDRTRPISISEPCAREHAPVFAKREGHPFWPAKIIRQSKNSCVVMFFGSSESAKIQKSDIRPDKTDPSELGIKMTSHWNRAYEEMQRYRKKLGSTLSGNQNADDSMSEASMMSYRGSASIKRRRESSTDSSLMQYPAGPSSVGNSYDMKIKPEANNSGDKEKLKEVIWREYQIQLKEALEIEKKKHEKILSEERIKLTDEKERALENVKKQLNEDFEVKMADVKTKQWCRRCWKEAIYHCCWNCSYCSKECQQTHWYSDHRYQCRRKKAAGAPS